MQTVTRDISFELLPENELVMGVCIAEGEDGSGRNIAIISTNQGLNIHVGDDRIQIDLKQLVEQSVAAIDEIRATHSLIEELNAKGVTESDLDELVHDVGSQEDSGVNNQGMEAQVLHILRQCGVEKGSEAIRNTWSHQEVDVDTI